MVQALNHAGISGFQVDTTKKSAEELHSELKSCRVALIDSIAFSALPDRGLTDSSKSLVRFLEKNVSRGSVGVLMHMLPSELAESGDPALLAETERELLPLAEVVITVSDSLAKKLERDGARKDRVFVIPPGRDGVPPCSPVHNSSERRFVCVSNWSPAKGTDLLLEAFAQSGVSGTLDLVGSAADRPYEMKINELIAELRLGSRVRILGELGPDRLAAIYAQAYAFLFASRSEGYPTVLAEALDASVPVIAFAIEPVVELVGEGGVLVPPFNVDEFAAAIRLLSTNETRRQELAKAAGVRALELATWRDSENQFVEVLSAAMSSTVQR